MRDVSKLKIEAYKSSTFKRSDLIDDAEFIGDFNPTDYTLQRSNSFATRPTQGTSKPENTFAHGNNDKLSIAFTFDGTGVNGRPGSVTKRVDKFLGLLEYRGTIHKPVYVKVIWGTFTFQGILCSASAKFVLFDRDGTPLRAKIDAEFEEVVNEEERLAEESSSSPDVDRVWVVHQGDRIDRIAYESYGRVDYWRDLARVNRLDNPRSLVPGQILVLPRLVH